MLELQRKMEKVVSRVYDEIEGLFKIRKTYEEQIKTIENTIKENNKEARRINKEIKAMEADNKEASDLKGKKEAITNEQKELQEKIPNIQTGFEEQYKNAMEAISEKIKEESCSENGKASSLENELIESHEEEKNSLQEVQKKIDGLQKLNRAEMPDSFRERLQAQIKEQEANMQAIQKSFEQKRETLQLKIEEAKRQPEVEKVDNEKNVLEEIVAAIKEDDWKQAEKLWEPFRKVEEVKTMVEEATVENIETESAVENIVEGEIEAVEEISEEKVEEVAKIANVEKVVEEKKEVVPTKVNAIYVDMVSEKIYADIGENEGKEYNFEKDMKISMLDRENNLSIIKRHVPNFARIVAEKEKGEVSEKSENDYNRYLEIFEKVDPFVLAVLDESHEDLRKYLKAIKNRNKEEMPCELFYNLQKLTKTEFSEAEQDEILDYVEENAYLAIQVKGFKKAKRIRKWRKFENRHGAFRAVMRWLRMEENAKQLTEGK